MPVYLDVLARPDDRSFKQASDRAERYFKDAGKDAGKQFSDGLSTGLRSSDGSIRRSAESAEKAYKKAADAAGQTRIEEAKLDDLRTRGTGGTALLTQTERLEKARRAEVSTTRTAVGALRDLDTAQHTAVASGSALSNLLSGMASGATGARLGGLASSAQGLSTSLGGASSAAIGATAGIAGLVIGVAAATKAAYDLGATWDNIGDTITGRTGKMGDELKSITDAVQQVGSQSALSLQDLGGIAGSVSQSLHLAGDPLQQMTQKIADLQQVTGQGVNVRELGRAFRIFDISDVQDQMNALNQLKSVADSTGIPVNDLLTTMRTVGKTAKEFGLGFGESAALITTFESAGLDADKAATGLGLALKNLAKQGLEPQQALRDTITEIKRLHDSGQETAAINLATSTFGKGYTDFLNAIEGGDLDVATLNEALKSLGDNDVIGEQKAATEDLDEAWKKFTHTLESGFKPVADTVFGTFNDLLSGALNQMNKILEISNGWGNAGGMNPTGPIAPDSPLGQMLLPGQPPGAAPGAPAPTIWGAPIPPGMRSNLSGWTGQAPWGSQGGAKTPDLPTVPLTGDPASLIQGFPQTSGLLGAAGTVIDAKQRQAQAESDLNTLEASNTATAKQIQDAKNNIAKSAREAHEAEVRLNEAKISEAEKYNKQMQGVTNDLGELGVGLDKDFGISKGLAGIAENITKFVGNLALAGPMAQLNAISKASPSQGGYGLMGMLGAQGAFGPNFTGIDSSQQGYGQSGYPGSQPTGATGLGGVNMPGDSVNYTRQMMEQLGIPALYQNPAGGGSPQIPQWVQEFVQRYGGPGLTASSTPHGSASGSGLHGVPGSAGYAVDVTGPQAQQDALAAFLKNNPSLSAMMIHQGADGTPYGVAGGQDVSGRYYNTPGGSYGDEAGMVHWAPATSGGAGALPNPLPVSIRQWNAGGLTPPSGGSGAEGWRDTVAGTVAKYGPQMGITGANQQKWVDAIVSQIGVESKGDPNAQNPNDSNGQGGTQSVSGLLQYLPSSYANSGGKLTGLPYMDPVGQIAGALFAPRNADGSPSATAPGAIGAGHGWGPVDTPISGASWGGPGIPGGVTGGAGQSPVFGTTPGGPMAGSALGLNPAGPGAGPGVGPTAIGGAEPPSGTGSGGIGITPGGSLDTALNLAASAFPGVGQAAATGAKLASRAIQYGAQVAGIGVQGWMETLLPTGGSQLASNNWATRLIGGLAGAAPALPNMAGKSATAMSKGGGQDQQGAQAGNTNNTNINVTNQRATEDGTGKDIAWHQTQANQGPGM